MQSKTKERIRDILYSNLATKEGKRKLAAFSNRSTSHISELIKNYKIGSANIIGMIIEEYKLEQIKNVTKDKVILEIIKKNNKRFKNEEISEISGHNKFEIGTLRRYITEKEGSFGFKFHALTLKIEQIAQQVEN